MERKIDFCAIIICVILIFLLWSCPSKVEAGELKIGLGKSLTYINTDNKQNNKNENLFRLSDYAKSFNLVGCYFKSGSSLCGSTNRILQQPIKIRFENGTITERKVYSDTLSLGSIVKTRLGRFSTSILLSNTNIYDKINGNRYSKSGMMRGIGMGYYKDNAYYGVSIWDRNNELNTKNAFTLSYNKFF